MPQNGGGGVWFPGTRPLTPFVWFFAWPTKIRNLLCTAQNLTGTITISDLELMGIFMQWLSLKHAIGPDLNKHQNPAIWCDNFPAVAWFNKFCFITSTVATTILRAFATRLHTRAAGILSVDHISGVYNGMTNVASQEHTIVTAEFLTLFSYKLKTPKNASWTLFQFTNRLTSGVCSILQHKPSTMAS